MMARLSRNTTLLTITTFFEEEEGPLPPPVGGDVAESQGEGEEELAGVGRTEQGQE